MKCDELKSVYIDRTGDWVRSNNDTGKFYLKDEVDAAIAELKAKLSDKDVEIDDLLRQNRELCQALQVMYSKEEYGKLQKELESLKASHYADSVDAGMRERRLRRALWLARAERAKEKQQLFLFSLGYEKLCIDGFYDPYSCRKELSPKQWVIDGFYDPYSCRKELSPKQWVKVFNKVEIKCLKKAELYK